MSSRLKIAVAFLNEPRREETLHFLSRVPCVGEYVLLDANSNHAYEVIGVVHVNGTNHSAAIKVRDPVV